MSLRRLTPFAVTFALGAALAWLVHSPRPRPTMPALAAAPTAATPRPPLSSDEQATIDLFREASASVVYITNVGMRRNIFSHNVFEVPQGTGSGFIWDTEGHVVTNFHVIQNASRAEVTFHDQSSYDAELVGVEPDKDLAVLKVKAPEGLLRALPLGTSHDLQVGQKTFAIGNPFGFDYTLTTGIVSALEREIRAGSGRPIEGVIQTDAAINPGNSGGPLLDSAGRLIGVTTAIYSPSGAYAGIGFAVPVDTIARIVPQLVRYGKVIRPGLGVKVASDAVAQRLGVEGVIVSEVPSGSPAEKAGMQGPTRDRYGRVAIGDVIVGIDGERVKGADDLYKLLDGRKVGERVAVKVRRGRDEVSLPIQLEALE